MEPCSATWFERGQAVPKRPPGRGPIGSREGGGNESSLDPTHQMGSRGYYLERPSLVLVQVPNHRTTTKFTPSGGGVNY